MSPCSYEFDPYSLCVGGLDSFQKLFDGGDGAHGAIHQSVGGCVAKDCLRSILW